MKILLTGATGLLGKPTVRALLEQGHELVLLARNPESVRLLLGSACTIVPWDYSSSDALPEEALQGLNGVIHLAGEPIGKGAWTEKKKSRIYDSRIVSTRALVEALRKKGGKPPEVFISASAIGIYGDRAEEELTESAEIAQPGSDFLSRVCCDWEKEALLQSIPGMRSIALRFGMILSSDGGVLGEMVPIFKLGLGGPLGDGKQWMSWIHVEDGVGAIFQVMKDSQIRGPINVTSPHPVRNRELSETLAKVLHRPCLLRVPGFMLRTILGEKAALVLPSQRVLPAGLMGSHYKFRFPTLEVALQNLLKSP